MVTYAVDGTTKPPLVVTGEHIGAQLFHDGPGDRRGNVTVSEGGRVRRWILFRDCSMIDCEVGDGAEVGRE